MMGRGYSTQDALAVLADRGQMTTARVLRNIEKQLDLRVQRDGDGIGDDEGKRMYTPADLDLLERVLMLQRAGLHLVEIRAILIDRDPYLLDFHANSLRRALDVLGMISREGHSPAA